MAELPCSSVNAGNLTSAANALRSGGLCIIPTDTVYGIAADVRNDAAVTRIYAAKGKGPASPLQMLFSLDLARIAEFAALNAAATSLIAGLGPGGWTVIVPARDGWRSPALADGATVGIRIPASTVVHSLVDMLGAPLVASSANRHGSPSPASCAAAIEEVGQACSFALDAGPIPDALDSTVIDLASDLPRILREGAIDRETIARILGMPTINVLRSVRP